MTDFYTNVVCEFGKILYRGVQDGQRVQKKFDYSPKLYIRSGRSSGWSTLKGEPLEEKKLPSISEARNFVKKYKEVENFKIYGNQRYEYAFISDNHPEQDMEYDSTQIIVSTIDIEVGSTNGFPDPADAKEPITAITMSINGKYYAYAYKDDYTPKEDGVHYTKCDDELDLIQKFLNDWEAFSPDIITGWNIGMFDIPYFVNRTANLLGEDEALRFSPWKKLYYRLVKMGNREHGMYDVIGCAVIDYIDLYKKYSPTPNQESYKLGHIAEVELGEKKVDFSEYENLNNLYEQNFELFMDYNIQDVRIVNKLEDKLKLLELVMTLAYQAKVNYEDVFSQVRMWDMIIFNKLKSMKIAIPPSMDRRKNYQYAGGYVKDPTPGEVRWLASFDLNSLYPHLIMQYNLSPETLIEPDDYTDEISRFLSEYGSKVCVETLLEKQLPLDWMKEAKVTLTPNGQFFRTDKQGFLAELMEHIYNSRVKYKNKQTEAKKAIQTTEDPEEKARLKKEAARYGALQQAFKVTLNSAYGAIGNEFFRFFDIRIAEAVTTSGQLSIRWIAKDINEYLNGILKTNDEDFIVASDTDSIYVTFAPLVDKVYKDQSDKKSIIAFMDKVCETKIQPFIDKSYTNLADYVNAYAQKMKMKREALADKAIWTAKKRYILNVYDNEGVKYNTPEIKITGLEAIKSSTPQVCKKKIKEGIRIILNQTEDDLINFVDGFRSEFYRLPPVDVAFPRTCNGLDDYHDPRSIYGNKTPIHTRGALLFNHHVKSHKLDKKYELIKEGEKIKFTYLKTPNPIQENVIAFTTEIPEELGLSRYVDFETQFDKTFLDPLRIILNAIGWRLEKNNSLEDFFS